jgi:hypothetical protein
MTQEDYRHPIAPPPELVRKWATAHGTDYQDLATLCMCVATGAAQWGADQELEACCKWLPELSPWSGDDLRRHRRPKPPSLKEQALEMLGNTWNGGHISNNAAQTIRRALEQLPDNE